MDEKYFPAKIERKWQERWAERGTFEVAPDDEKRKFYCLEMLPYPSGRLHMGHVRNYSIGDALSWYKRLQGFNVLHPIGWDSFGQPAEQAAIKQGVNPRDWTEDNIEQMKAQLKTLGIGYDWSREMAAHRPDYYKFDQWFFLKMLEKGLAYRKDSEVNWCPKCETTLSNEQASGGICWRCGSPVEKQNRPQWFLKITDYADELLADMSEIEDGWPERVLTMQKNWIGKSKGANVRFALSGSENTQIEVFTTRIDTIFGVNAIVLAPDHPIVEEHFESFESGVREKIVEIRAGQAKPVDYGEEVEKAGVATGLSAVNSFSSEEVPVWVGNYVLMSYGTGAVMSVPAHDERDGEFARKYDLDIRHVVMPVDEEAEGDVFTGYGKLENSGEWSGLDSKEAILSMTTHAETEGFGESAETYRLRDWGISRQRFWGAPIPIVYCASCGAVPVSISELPVELPESAPFTGVGESPLAKVSDFVNTECPKCGEAAKRETDTMDTFVDSTWYYYRYLDPQNGDAPFDKEAAEYWMPVDLYIGGIDHAVMHLLYTRFWTKMMRDIGLVSFSEPVNRLLTQGMVVGESFYSKDAESYVFADDVEIERDDAGKIVNARMKDGGGEVRIAVEKMGKSKLNGVDPDDMIEVYGADAVRLFVMFAAPVENELVWQESGIEGAVRFLQRVWRFVHKWRSSIASAPREVPNDLSKEAVALRRKAHQTAAKITESFESGQFNTPVASLMELSNALGDFKVETENASEGDRFAVSEAVRFLIIMLAPYSPHTAEELWEAVTNSETGIVESGGRFPVFDEEVAEESEIEIAVQVNGKLRSKVMAPAGADNQTLENLARADGKIADHTNGKEVIKVIVVPNRLVNIVVKG
ncbi:MAG: leucine--tRNA ligase [Pyrinomonadaceae bacterium]|nr:leucine--tRNA ligase [Pyrinomonadaceae bacterium]